MKMNRTRLAFLSVGLALGGLPLSGYLMARSADVDRKAGQATFRIQRQGDEIYMQPVLEPRFKLNWIKGPKPTESQILPCSVWGREIHQDEVDPTNLRQDVKVITVIVLRCGDTEYGINTVEFAYDQPGGRK